MKLIDTSGVIIDVQKDSNDGKVKSFDVFTEDYGIMRWFLRSKISFQDELTFADVKITGYIKSDTSGQVYKIDVIFYKAQTLLQNGSYDSAKNFIKIVRSVVFDGIKLDNIFIIVKQAIKNFLDGFNTETVSLKGLYLLCKQEGYSVDTDWMNSLTEEDKALAKEMLSTRVDVKFPDNASMIVSSISDWILAMA